MTPDTTLLRPPTEEENDYLQANALLWRSKTPPDIHVFEEYGELNYSFFVDRGITKIWWRNENFQCKIYLISSAGEGGNDSAHGRVQPKNKAVPSPAVQEDKNGHKIDAPKQKSEPHETWAEQQIDYMLYGD